MCIYIYIMCRCTLKCICMNIPSTAFCLSPLCLTFSNICVVCPVLPYFVIKRKQNSKSNPAWLKALQLTGNRAGFSDHLTGFHPFYCLMTVEVKSTRIWLLKKFQLKGNPKRQAFESSMAKIYLKVKIPLNNFSLIDNRMSLAV